MKYKPVAHSHIVPAGYLREWATGRLIAMRRTGGRAPVTISVRDAGVRSNFYRRTRPSSGETIYDIEWSMQQAEDVALPVLRSIRDRWPLGLEDKGMLGQLLGLQHTRGTAFRAAWEVATADRLAVLRDAPDHQVRALPGITPAETVERAAQVMTSDTRRLTEMLVASRAAGIVFTSMHWTLVNTPRRLATSDHPIVTWSRGVDRRRVASREQAHALFDTREVFVPVAPDLLLMMSWRDDIDSPTVVPGQGRHVATANAFIVANADEQWFHEIEVDPWIAKGSRHPLTSDLLGGYSDSEASQSSRRKMAWQFVEEERSKGLSNEPITAVSATVGGGSSSVGLPTASIK